MIQEKKYKTGLGVYPLLYLLLCAANMQHSFERNYQPHLQAFLGPKKTDQQYELPGSNNISGSFHYIYAISHTTILN